MSHTTTSTEPLRVLRAALEQRDNDIATAEDRLEIDVRAIELEKQAHRDSMAAAQEKLDNLQSMIARDRKARSELADAISRLEEEQ